MSEPLARDLARMGIRDRRVLRAIAETPRTLFVPEPYRERADGDHPLPIGHGQTISQPFMVGWMTEALELRGEERVLEVGTGSGYQAAVLSRLCRRVFSLEIVPELAASARALLASLGIGNVDVRLADGTEGLPEEAPFDRIIVTAAAASVPPPLVAQLGPGGIMVIPVGAADAAQFIHVLVRGRGGEVSDRALFAVRFVPLRSTAERVGLDSRG